MQSATRNASVDDANGKADVIREKKMLEAKERFQELKVKHEEEVNQRNQAIIVGENRIKQKEGTLNQKLEEVNRDMTGSREQSRPPWMHR
jgi:ribonuclease Y